MAELENKYYNSLSKINDNKPSLTNVGKLED